MAVKVFVFDYGGVIMNYKGLQRICQQLAKNLGITPEELQSAMKEEAVLAGGSDLLMKGILTAEEIEDGIIKRLGHGDDIQKINDTKVFKAWLGPGVAIDYNDCVLHAINRLHTLGYKLVLLTNNFYLDRERKWERTPMDKRCFNLVIQSSTEGEMKPDRKIYEITQERIKKLLGAEPEEVIFLDDLKENLVAPREMGWNTIWVDPEQPKEAIKELERIIGVDLKI